MNTQVLIKCLDELKKESPNIEYVKGMLETLITLSGAPVISNEQHAKVTPQIKELLRTESVSDEGTEYLARYHGRG